GRRPTTARSISVDPAELAAVLARAGIAPDLRTLIEALRGPVADRRAAAAAEQARWDGAFRRLRERATAIDPRLDRWADELAAGGLLRRLARDAATAERLAGQATAVLERLPARGVPIAHLAAAALGDSHALDDGAPVSTVVLRAGAVMTGPHPRDRHAEESRAVL